IVGQGDIVGRSGYFSLNLSANSVMRGRLDARRTLKSLVADLRTMKKSNVSFIAQMCEIKLIVPNPYAINVCSININYPFSSKLIS
ncbi:hypothetical protein ACIXUN_21085, partial [Bacteroides fragilis]